MRSSHLPPLDRAIANPACSRRRSRLACLPLVLLVTLTGCAASTDSSASGRNYESAEQSIGRQDPCVFRVRGKPVVVNLWASWCGPCRKEMPILQAAHARYGERVQFVGVDTADGAEVAAAFLTKVGVTYPQLSDADATLLKHLRIPGLPVTVVIGADGCLVERHIGALGARDLDVLLNRLVCP